MTIIEPKVILTKAEVETIRAFSDMCRTFDFNPWDAFEAVEDKCGLGDVTFEYVDE